ncbi:glycosyltransferase family 2 protein [Mesorhizobium loti]|uniref:glycosyltransferase family 2 protein n=1 Tax=Rhizobium loti TaxID=381 RepID=UPI001FD8ECF9|nr:glycosyltransferase family A protein [Mesorhizobium loti]
MCIATHRRPEGLARLLESLSVQVGAPDFEVIVVDNDVDGSAQAVCDRFVGDLALTYCRETVPGVAATRNRAVAIAAGEFLAFIDDDEWAEPDWLGSLHGTLTATGADAAFGNIANLFAPDVAPHIRTSGMFETFDFADGAELRWWQTRTGNALVRRAALPDRVAPFDLGYGLTGGEDTHLFKAMLDRGARLVWSSGALVGSLHSSSNANMGWLLRRALRYGGTGAEIEWLHLPLRRRVKLGLRCIRPAVRDLGLAALRWRSDKAGATKLLVSGTMSAGRLLRLLGRRVEIYKRPTGAA